MRVFVGIDLDDEIRTKIARLLAGVCGFAPDARWVRPESLHVTLKFIGEQKPEQVAAITERLQLVKAARICGVPAVRNPFVPARSLRPRQFSRRPGLWKRYGQVRMLRSFAAQFHDKMKRAGLATPDGVVGVIETGSFDGSLLRQTLANLPEGTWELVCHPGYDDADLRASHTRLLASRDQERQLLTSPELQQFLDEHEIRVISYCEFAGK